MIVGIPVTTTLLQTLIFLPLNFLLGSDDATPNLQVLQGSVVTLLLLAVSYLRVRRMGRDFLTLLWAYVVIIGAIWTIAAGAVFIAGIEFPTEAPLSILGRTFFIYGLATLPHLLALLWFARQGSRLSLTHAFFLIIFAPLTLFGSVHGFQTTDSIAADLAKLLVGGAIALSVMLLTVWLLGNFDLRGPEFRRNAVIGLVAATILSAYVGVLFGELIGYGEGPYSNMLPLLDVVFGLAAFAATTAFDLLTVLVLFALAYLVRMRQVSADAPFARPNYR